MDTEIKALLENVKNGVVSVDDALLRLKTEPFDDLGFAKVDLHRKIRQGAAEVIYGERKTPQQIGGIVRSMLDHGQDRILITRLKPEAAEETAAPLFLTERFSPGYGDSPLEMQKQVLDLLDAENKLGITLSKGYMMSPSKSITAIMGLADHPVTGRLATCDECVLKDKCRLRREGKRCGSA